ncbi:MAG: hypothetical protein ABW175_04455 [Bradyrhizobium sp.]
MEITVIARQALLYGHVIAFALALAAIVREDLHLLRAERIDTASLHTTARLVKWLLLALWVTGTPMLVLEIGFDMSLLLAKPKLLTKLIVVVALTLNGLLLHFVAFPNLTRGQQDTKRAVIIAAMLGAVSTASWLYATFVGVSRFVSPHLSLQTYVGLYLLTLANAVVFAMLVVPKLLLKSSADSNTTAARKLDLSATLCEVESAMLALGDIHRRLRKEYLAQQFPVHPHVSPTGSAEKPDMAASGRKQRSAA